MSVGIQVPAGAPDWVNYLETTWLNSFSYRSHGSFSPGSAPYDQWVAGNAGTTQSGVILNGDFSYVPPGGFVGSLDTLEFGSHLTGSTAAGYDLNTVLTLDLSDATASAAFTYAIYYLSNAGDLTHLYDYLGEQGTTQTGNSGGLGETLYSFAGNDVLTGAGASDFDTFFYRADLNAGGWGDDTITDFVDGNDLIVLDGFGWDDYSDFVSAGGSISGSTISYAGNTIAVAFAGGGTLDSSDLIFAA
ncbi:hypothetical protein [Rhizobium sp. GCM10022189]|uniref:hypothetical protein n=1 Tax=Rhizobium sp. GCM10022189 TaxID=3252654 RepID=UPI000DD86176